MHAVASSSLNSQLPVIFVQDAFTMFPTQHTFIHFRLVPLYVSRSVSAPPVLTSKEAKVAGAANPRKAKRKRQQKPDEDDIVFASFASLKIREQWSFLAAKLCKHSQQEARLERDVRHHQLTLPKSLFLDLAFYAFKKDSASTSALLKLFQAGVLTEPKDDEIYVCCSRRQLQSQHENPIRKVIEEGRKVLEVAAKGRFAVVFNNDVIVFLQWDPEATVSNVIQKIMHVVRPGSCANAIAVHRNTPLRAGSTLAANGLRAGSTLAVNPL